MNSRNLTSPKSKRPSKVPSNPGSSGGAPGGFAGGGPGGGGGGGGKKSSFGMNTIESQLMDIIRQQDGTVQQNAVGAENLNGENGEDRYSRKVFVGGLPPDIDEDEIQASFRQYGPLIVDWPHKNESKSYFPPKVSCPRIL